MRRFTCSLENVAIAAPCPADWEDMIGNDRVRFCGQCELNVYNLSALSKREAESLIARSEDRLCIRFYRRKDGSIMTRDCPVGLRALKRRASRIKRAAASSLVGFLAGIGANAAVSRVGELLLGSYPSTQTLGSAQGSVVEPPSQQPSFVVGQAIRARHIPAKRGSHH